MLRQWWMGLVLMVGLTACAVGTQENESCSTNEDCSEGICLDGACVDAFCESDFDCPVGQICSDRACVPIGDGPPNNATPNNNPNNTPNNGPNNTPNNNPNNDPNNNPNNDPNNNPNNDPNNNPNNDPNNDPNNNPGGCMQDTDCSAEEHCENQTCVPGCHTDDGCLVGQVCDVDAHTCVTPGCTGDEECPDGQVCDLESGDCVPAPVVCGDNTCDQGQWCDYFTLDCISELPGAECTSDAACNAGQACSPSNDADDNLVLVCRPDQGASAGGEACENADECRSGLCVLGTCYEACAEDGDCQTDGATCRQIELTPVPEHAYDAPICLSVLPCDGDDACPDGEVCALVPVGDGLEALCSPQVGDLPAGSLCSDDAQCASGACFGNDIQRCLGICNEGDGCQPGNTACVEVNFLIDDNDTPDNTDDDVTAPFNICDWSEGTQQACQSNAQCGGGEICTLGTDDNDALGKFCRPAWGAGVAAAACTVDNDCQSGICLEADGICLGACAVDSDCLGDNLCAAVPLSNEPDAETLDLCVTPPDFCTSDLDCEGGNICQPVADPNVPNTIAGACLPPVGAGLGRAGESCTQNADCASDFCIQEFGGEGSVCYGICEEGTNRGCNDGTVCYPNMISLTFDQDTDSTLDDRYDSTTACMPDFGSFDQCNSDDGCAFGEMCYPLANRTRNAFEPRCVDAFNAGGVGPGGSCITDAQCAADFCVAGGLFSDFCFGLCATSGDCLGLTLCQPANLTVNTRGTDTDVDDITAPVNICQ